MNNQSMTIVEDKEHKMFFKALKAAVRFYALYTVVPDSDCAPDKRFYPTAKEIVDEILIETKISEDDLLEGEYKKLVKIAKRQMD